MNKLTKFIWAIFAAMTVALASQATAEQSRVLNKSDFVRLIDGKTLTRPLIKLQVLRAGSIRGKGAKWDITGQWIWQDGYFCRNLNWGGDDLGYNCQEVSVRGNKIRFRSDKGAGDYADFRLN